MCPVCGGSSFRETSWVSATRRARRGFACVTCGARLRSDQVTSTADEAGEPRSTIPAPPSESDGSEETWRPPSLRKPPAASGTFESVPSVKGPLKRQA